MLYPKIGIPLLGKDLLSRFLQGQYERCLSRAGASVWMLIWQATEEYLQAALETCDGFLFPGRGAIDAKLYHQASVAVGQVEPVRDAFEQSLLQAVLEAQKPIFCIDRGMQLLNVVYGGTLMQNSKEKQEYSHYDCLHITTATHPVELDPYSLLSDLLHADTLSVNSLHRQMVDTVGEGLFVAADSPEGFVEALEIEDYPFCLAVQWRPEYMAARTPAQQQLFRAFVDACRSKEYR